MPKPKPPVWMNFDYIIKNNNIGNWTSCEKYCKELQGISSCKNNFSCGKVLMKRVLMNRIYHTKNFRNTIIDYFYLIRFCCLNMN